MNIWQAFTMALKSIAMKKTRSFLTMLGIIIGVASVVIMVSVVQGQNKKNMEYFEKMGNNKITVSAYSYYDSNNETSQKLYDYCLSLSNLVDGITPDVEIALKADEEANFYSLTVETDPQISKAFEAVTAMVSSQSAQSRAAASSASTPAA